MNFREEEHMKKIQVLGPGCPNCRRLADLADDVARELGLEYELEKVTDITRITQFGVMASRHLRGEQIRVFLAVIVMAVMLVLLYQLLATPELLIGFARSGGGH